ncbi:MAG: phytanoyl-CoA dioxygenase family protein [Cytophagales bacterium]|nr:phytanoyl-CoA dioxygenase family protein [Cytophagales bacterium]
MLTEKDKQQYDKDGYIIKRSFYSRQEIDLLFDISRHDNVIGDHTYGRKDKDGNTTKLALWYSLGNNIYSAFARSERMVNGVELLLDGRPCHFHTKLMQKEPKVGGAWEWHQDYGYWYHDGFLYPHMMSVMIALTTANKENGCLQVIKGSHLIGRIEHTITGDQKGSDANIVNVALKRLKHEFVELEPGDTLFFHGNLLHRSDKNNSNQPRWSLISTWNRIDNKPYKAQNPSSYTPVSAIADDEILKSKMGGISEASDFHH